MMDDDEYRSLDLGVDESYSLNITPFGDCTITSETIWGALHGMETFTQLLVRDSASSVVQCNFVPLQLSDSSRFSHRGMLIDTSRHYLSVKEIERIIDLLPMSKFNVLHWHTVDAQSFPLDTPSAPKMVSGAYAPSFVYAMTDLEHLTRFAGDRGVRMVFEVDVPGHAASWRFGEPTIMADCIAKYTNINNYALNPTLDRTYDALSNVLSDIVDFTNTKYLHLGGDEVVYGCWSNDASIVAWMAANGVSSYNDLLATFVHRADAIARSLGTTPMHWEEVFKAGVQVQPDTIFQVWTNSDQIAAVTKANFSTVASPSNVWYLDHLEVTWQTMYSYDPCANLSAAQADKIVGGEVCMWGERVDESNLESVIYPRAFAVGERLWSRASVTDQVSAKDRLAAHRCRMQQRGFHSAPVDPGFCDPTLTFV